MGNPPQGETLELQPRARLPDAYGSIPARGQYVSAISGVRSAHLAPGGSSVVMAIPIVGEMSAQGPVVHGHLNDSLTTSIIQNALALFTYTVRCPVFSSGSRSPQARPTTR